MNRRFFTFQQKKRPYIILKWAQTQDGFIDTDRKSVVCKRPEWITSEHLRPLVHKWRTEEDAIMVGTQTALKDNPQLTAREWAGRNPLRIVIDRKLVLPENLNLFDGSAPTLVLTEKKKKSKTNIEFLQLDFTHGILLQLMNELYRKNVQSIIVEGGSRLLESFIKEGLWDEARVFTGNKRFHKGIKAPSFPFEPISEDIIGHDRLTFYRKK